MRAPAAIFVLTLAFLGLFAVLPAGIAGALIPSDCPVTAAPLPVHDLPATARALREGRPITIVAFGSSSTEGAGASGADRTYPARLEARLLHAIPGLALKVLNRGRGGEEVAEMLARLDREVLAAAPTLVVWQAGANAVLRGLSIDVFRTALQAGLARLRAAGADVVLMDNQRAPRILANPMHRDFEALMTSVAAVERVPLFSRSALMRAWEAAGAPSGAFLVDDGLHHNDRGYDCLAAALAESLAASLHMPAVLAGAAPAAGVTRPRAFDRD